MFWNILGAFAIGGFVGAAIWLLDYWTLSPPWFIANVFYAWVLFIGLAVMLLVLGLWAGGVVRAAWLAYAAAAWAGGLVSAWMMALFFPVVANLTVILQQLSALLPKP